ncbi:hypothetical protein HMPREF3191_00206 [Veillonellaceae bacterium DNF00626]|nr:hypothetical protein HMPREF3191_00206 [Veillonellaceae bacterium DNF00626]
MLNPFSLKNSPLKTGHLYFFFYSLFYECWKHILCATVEKNGISAIIRERRNNQ